MSTVSPSTRRWPRSQRLVLTTSGSDAEGRYRSAIVAARAEGGGRKSFEDARSEWAAVLALHPDDGIYLIELSAGPVSLGKLVEMLDASGYTRRDALEALGRLWDAGFISSPVNA